MEHNGSVKKVGARWAESIKTTLKRGKAVYEAAEKSKGEHQSRSTLKELLDVTEGGMARNIDEILN